MAATGHSYGATGTPTERLSPDDQATLTEAEMRPVPEGRPLTSAARGERPRITEFVEPVEEPVRALFPGEPMPGEEPVDIASDSLVMPHVEDVRLSEAERSFDDPRHIMRGGPQMASR